jgi:hypothetical protein
MPSSTSSSDGGSNARDRYARQTAADRPGVAQPVPSRPVPERPWPRILVIAVVLFLILMVGWEFSWRVYGVTPGMRNTYGFWAIQRRRIDTKNSDATVLLGGSRAYYDIQLPVWERLTGHRPIQLAFESTSPMTYLEDLAADPNFTGVALVSVEPSLFFSGTEDHGGGVTYSRHESPSQMAGQALSMHLVEPYFAFDDPDLSLQRVLARLPWAARSGRSWPHDIRKIAIYGPDRNAYLWDKVAVDPEYRGLVLQMWRDRITPSADNPASAPQSKTERAQIERAAKAVAQLRARGAAVLFLRLPSGGPFLAYEDREFPRVRTWDALLAATGTPGIHFADYPELQGYYLPEWSHMTRSEAERFTAALYGIVVRNLPRLQPSINLARNINGKPAGHE